MKHSPRLLRSCRTFARQPRHASIVEPLENRIAPAFAVTLAGTVATFTGDTADDVLTITNDGRFLHHNTFTPTNGAFSSDIDFDPTTPDDQTISVASPFTLNVDGGGGSDTITFSTGTAAVEQPGKVAFVGGRQGTATWMPAGPGAGSVTLFNGTYNYSGATGGVAFTSLATLLLRTPAGGDSYALDSTGQLRPVKASAAYSAFLDSVPSLQVDLGIGDGLRTEVSDSFSVTGIPAGVTSLSVKLGAGADLLSVSGVTSLAGINFTADGDSGASGRDTISFTGDVSVTLADNALSLPSAGGKIALTSFEQAYLTGGSADQTYDVSGWTGGGFIDGADGTDTISAASKNATVFELSDASLKRTGAGDLTLSGIERANFTGGGGHDEFRFSGFTGSATVDGGTGGKDYLFVTAPSDAITYTSVDVTHGRVTYGSSSIIAANTGSVFLAGASHSLVGDGVADVTWHPANSNSSTSLGGYTIYENGPGPVVLFNEATPTTVSNFKSLTLQTPEGSDVFDLANDPTPGFGRLYGLVNQQAQSGASFTTRFTQIETVRLDLGGYDGATPADDDVLLLPLNTVAGLKNVTISTGAGDDSFTLSHLVTTLSLPVAGGGVTVDLGAGANDEFHVQGGPAITLGSTSLASTLTFPDQSVLTYKGAELYELTAKSLMIVGAGSETVEWLPEQLTSSFGGSVDASNSGSLVFVNGRGEPLQTIVYHLTPEVGDRPLYIRSIHELDLQTKGGADNWNLDNGPAGYTVFGTYDFGTNHWHDMAVADLDVLSLDLGAHDSTGVADRFSTSGPFPAGLSTFILKTGDGDDTVSLGAARQFGAGPGESVFFDGGSGQNKLTMDTWDPIVLTNSAVAIGAKGRIEYSGVEFFELGYKGYAAIGRVTYAGSGTDTVEWLPSPNRTEDGTVIFNGNTLLYHGELALKDVADLTVTTGPAADVLVVTGGLISGTVGAATHRTSFSGVGKLTIDLGSELESAADSVEIDTSYWPGPRSLKIVTGGGDDDIQIRAATYMPDITVDAGSGEDTVTVYTDGSLTVSDAEAVFDPVSQETIEGAHVAFGSSVESLVLLGGDGDNVFRFHGWSGKAAAYGFGGKDVFDLSGGFTGMGAFAGGDGDDTFIAQTGTAHALSGAGAGASFDGGAGTDTIHAQGDLDFHLTDSSLQRSVLKTASTPAQSIANSLTSIEHAELIGGAGRNLLDARGFSGTADLSGEGAIDNLLASLGGGELYGFHANATAEEKADLHSYTRDNFFASAAAAVDHIDSTTRAGNILSFRYSPHAVTYTIPNRPGADQAVGGGLHIQLEEGAIGAVEGSIYGDHLTGNRAVNFLIGGRGNDVLRAVGFDYLYGGPGHDRLLGITPYRFESLSYPIPASDGVPSAG